MNKAVKIILIVVLFVFIRKQFISVQHNIKKYHNLTMSKLENIEKMASFYFIESIENIIGDRIENFISLFKKYTAFDQNGEIKLVRIGRDNDGGYIVPEIALKKADALIGYGILDDISFEEMFSDIYQKPSYGFDCTTKNIEIKNKLTQFIPECIGSSINIQNAIYNNSSMGKFTSFDQQLEKLSLQDKKIFVKVDIEGNEYEVFDDILKHTSNITGIAMELHFYENLQQFKAAKDLMIKLQKDFILLYVNGNAAAPKLFSASNVEGMIPRAIELIYINKNLVDKYQISEDQKHPISFGMPLLKEKIEHGFKIN